MKPYRLFSSIAIYLAITAAGKCAEPECRRTNENLNAVLWVQTSAEFNVCARQAFLSAKASIVQSIDDPSWLAAIEQTDGAGLPPAIIMDLDETVLDNSAFQAWLVKSQNAFEKPLWEEWVKECRCASVPGALELSQFAIRNRVSVLFVTNRDVTLKPPTVANLKKLGFTVSDNMSNVLCTGETGEGETAPWKPDKSDRRAFLAKRFRIVALFGDQLSDFVSCDTLDAQARQDLAFKYKEKWGVKWFMIPNPTYGGWEQSLRRSTVPLSDKQILEHKFAALRAWEKLLPEQTNLGK